jgi:hypothetical protein
VSQGDKVTRVNFPSFDIFRLLFAIDDDDSNYGSGQQSTFATLADEAIFLLK